jgi:maltooligosyltrehalose trehalohydrolase
MNDGVIFNLWAPSADTVELLLDGQRPQRMLRDADGWCQLFSHGAGAGTRYQFRINGKLCVPDPASLFQPDDVSGPSEVVDAKALRDQKLYVGRPWAESVIYELHVGTFSEEGTYAGVEKKLPYLRNLGITAIELMPLNDVPGRRNWGYDGVLLNAPNARYGRPQDLKRLLNAAHEQNIMVYLDVVYNHFGPHLNYLHAYAKPFFSDAHTTGWGPAVNLEGADGATVRAFLIENALLWIRDYGFDGLRLDAVHALKDSSEQHFLTELVLTLRAKLLGRHVHLMLENEANQARYLERPNHRTQRYNAQWGDDFHNALHVLLTGECEGYYSAFADQPLMHLARSLAEGFAFQGENFSLHDEPRGEPSRHLPPDTTIFFAQNHDQVGNRALGERLTKLTSPAKLKMALALVLLSPHIPMLFMGEEAAAETPFLFFCDWSGDLAEGTRQGRRKEFSGFTAFATPALQKAIPDPCDETTFEASRLDWDGMERAPLSREFRTLTRDLLSVRQQKIVPLIKDRFVVSSAELLDSSKITGGVNVRWRTAKGDELQIIANFGDGGVPMPVLEAGEVIWASGPPTDAVEPHQIIVRRSASSRVSRLAV